MPALARKRRASASRPAVWCSQDYARLRSRLEAVCTHAAAFSTPPPSLKNEVMTGQCPSQAVRGRRGGTRGPWRGGEAAPQLWRQVASTSRRAAWTERGLAKRTQLDNHALVDCAALQAPEPPPTSAARRRGENTRGSMKSARSAVLSLASGRAPARSSACKPRSAKDAPCIQWIASAA